MGALEKTERCKTNTNLPLVCNVEKRYSIRADRINNSFDNLEGKSRAVLNASTVFIGSIVYIVM
jgi:hypothetical protein